MRSRSTFASMAFVMLHVAPGAAPAEAQVPAFDALAQAPIARFALPPALFEASGLAWHPDGYVLAHDDEVGVVHFIDPESGEVVDRLSLGADFATGDFEGVAVLGDGSLVVTTSTGTLVRVDPRDGSTRSWSAGVVRECEIEGLALSRGGDEDELVLACKRIHRGRDRGALHLLATSLSEPGTTRLLARISSGELEQVGVPTPFWASGVEAVEGGFLVISARNRVAVFVDDAGAMWGVHRLPADLHEQPEGITVDPSGTIWIADEGGRGRAGHLTRYDPTVPGGDPGR